MSSQSDELKECVFLFNDDATLEATRRAVIDACKAAGVRVPENTGKGKRGFIHMVVTLYMCFFPDGKPADVWKAFGAVQGLCGRERKRIPKQEAFRTHFINELLAKGVVWAEIGPYIFGTYMPKSWELMTDYERESDMARLQDAHRQYNSRLEKMRNNSRKPKKKQEKTP